MIQIKKLSVLFLTLIFLFPGCAYHHGIARLPKEPLYDQAIMFGNIQYLPLLKFCSYYDLDWDWDLVAQKIKIHKDGNALILRPNSGLALLNDKTIKLEYPIEYRNGSAYISAESAAFISGVFKAAKQLLPAIKRYGIRTVVIDPGHGGKDPGAVSRYGTREKDIVLDVSKRLKRYLEESGVKVIMTRGKDVFIPLYKRAEIANKINADLFISVHANAARYSRTKGFEVFYLSEATDDKARALAAAENASLEFEEGELAGGKNFSTKTTLWDLQLKESRRESKVLAYYICNMTSDNMSMSKRGVKGANFAVLKKAVMPAVLIEVGFLTNRREESKLKKRPFREKIARSVSSSILAYKEEYERTNGFSK